MENGTGVFYQAMPAVGPDGKNVMKLIPVQKVNGQFVQTQVLLAKNAGPSQDCTQAAHASPASLQLGRVPMLQPTSDGRFILKAPTESNTLFNCVKSQHTAASEGLQNAAGQIHIPLFPPKTTPLPLQLPLQNNKDMTVNATQLPATTKSPVFSSRHYLQIPPNATVQTVPTSSLPQTLQNRICTSGNAPPNLSPGLSTVMYVSSVNSLQLAPNQQLQCLPKSVEVSKPSPHVPGPKAPAKSPSVSVSSVPSPKPGQGVAAPQKWLVQEGTGSSGPCLIPLTSGNMTNDILKAVKQMEGAKLVNRGDAKETASTKTCQEKVSAGAHNTLVMCDGKVYFVGKKNSDLSKDVISRVEHESHVENVAQKSSAAGSSNAAQKQNLQNSSAGLKANEIIDLCDDEDENENENENAGSAKVNLPAEMVAENDEDSNVIFVSYIPPKSETETSKSVPETTLTQTSDGKDTDTPESVEKEDEENKTSDAAADSEAGKCPDDAPAAGESERAASQRPDNVCDLECDVVEKVSDDLVSQCGKEAEEVKEADTAVDKPPVELKPQQKSDPELKQIFGITSDLRVSLQKMEKEPDPGAARRSVNKRTLEGIRKLIHSSNIETKIRQLIQAQAPIPKKEDQRAPKDAKRRKLEQERERTESTSASSPDTVKCEQKMEGESTRSCRKAKLLQNQCPGAAAAAKEEQETSPDVHCCSDHSTHTQTDASTCSLSQKTPTRHSKGSRRTCKASPCRTKVGVLKVNTSAKTHDKPALPPALKPADEPEKSCDVPKIETSDFSPKQSKNVSEKPRDKTPHASQSDICKDDKLSPQNVDAKTEDERQPELLSSSTSPETAACSSSSMDVKRDGSAKKSNTVPPKVAVPKQPETQRQAEMKARISTAGPSFVGEKIPSEFYSLAPLDPEEIERQERIRRLKDLLKEKEAALEKMRRSMM